MAFKLSFLIFTFVLVHLKASDAWSQDPWFTAIQSIKYERSHTNLLIKGMQNQISTGIYGKITAMSWTLNGIKGQAEYVQNLCAMETIRDIETFYSTMYMIHECRNNAQVNQLANEQMQKINNEWARVKQGQITCQDEIYYQECADRISDQCQTNLLTIRGETQREVERVGAENMACVDTRGNEMALKVNDISDKWRKC